MKKLLILMMVLVMTMPLAACSEAEGAGDSASGISTPSRQEATLVDKEVNFTTLLVPSDFGEFYDKNGNAVAEGPNSSIVITNINETDVTIEDITEDYLVGLMGNSYSNIEVLAFENPVTVAGVDAMSIKFTGDGVTNGKNKSVCLLMLFFSVDGINCEQQFVFTYETGANTSLEANMRDIIDSISFK